eukprot:CAMPEP_0182924330 /NCGR_PEP_ID=MMETSP0105_2-20130417/5980_1 /TAXON_ID=81532 ORGANISM="Acanthoeca-like sp., Strain 10tr" /NCGR_SAMPLE_ID=MMETSP0105_2 /ASSEMBLY_ACC=CAM_ASM_000205 /LENGTH=127 /DNA_ID=CAMNT_0025062097 /DNA_START=34 /DNA_END=414 /DNA_ORIENTATION=-
MRAPAGTKMRLATARAARDPNRARLAASNGISARAADAAPPNAQHTRDARLDGSRCEKYTPKNAAEYGTTDRLLLNLVRAVAFGRDPSRMKSNGATAHAATPPAAAPATNGTHSPCGPGFNPAAVRN